MPYIILLIYMAIAFALQFLAGDFPVSFFSFPLNLILFLLWVGAMVWVWKHHKKSLFASFILSKGASVCAIAVFILFALVIGFTGNESIAYGWGFVAFMLYFQTVLLFVIMRGFRAKTATGAHLGEIRWRFILNHAGLLIAVSSAFWGAPDSENVRLQAFRDIPIREGIMPDGSSTWLPYEMELKDFKVEIYENGSPAMFEAEMLIDGKPVNLKVNHPYSKGLGENIYLTGYDSAAGKDSRYCVIQVVKEPWKYGAAAGMILMLAGAMLLFISGPERRYGEED